MPKPKERAKKRKEEHWVGSFFVVGICKMLDSISSRRTERKKASIIICLPIMARILFVSVVLCELAPFFGFLI